MGSTPKQPKQAAVAAAPRQSALDIKKAQLESERDLFKRRGFAQTEKAGESGFLATVLG